MAPSRLADDFLLDLRTTPPDQSEEDLLREFVAWLRMLHFGGGGPYASIKTFESALRVAAQPLFASPPPSPLSSPPSMVHFIFGSPIAAMRLDPALAGEYFRSAFRIWATEIRPKVHAICCGSTGCCASKAIDEPKTDECLLLARVDVPIVASSGKWVVDDTRDVFIDESRRPVLVHLRLFEELITTAVGGGAGGISVVAAGIVGTSASRLPVFGNLAATKNDKDTLTLSFDGYVSPDTSPTPGSQYVIKCIPLTNAANTVSIAVVERFDPAGIVMRIARGTGAALGAGQIDSMQLSVEISRIG